MAPRSQDPQERGQEEEAGAEEPEGGERLRRTPWVLWAPAWFLVLLGAAISLIGGWHQWFERAAERMTDRAAYAAHVLHAATLSFPPPHVTGLEASSYAFAAVTVIGAIGVALAGLFLKPRETLDRAADALHAVHSGHIGDYVVYLVGGIAILGGLTGLAVT